MLDRMLSLSGLLGALSASPGSAIVRADTTPSDSATSGVEQTVDAVADATVDVLSVVLRIGGGVLVGILAAFIIVVSLRTFGRRRAIYMETARLCRNALYVTCALTGGFIGAQFATLNMAKSWRDIILHALVVLLIIAGTWLIAQFLKAVEATVIAGVQAGGDQGRANRVITQAQILRRVAEVVVIICGFIGIVMTFPSARLAMGSLVASAGLVSVIAGLAAQSTLGNLFAGLQLAATDAIRVDDTVEVDGQFGQIEEITLTYVVVKLWDERRLILPSTQFTQKPFTNWSRRSHQMLGTVILQVDWRVPVAQLRAQLATIVAACPAWDGRTCSLLITDTSEHTITARATLSAANGDDLWTLRCHVREELIGWMQREAPYALPRVRVEVDQVEVTQDPEPERVAQLAEELVALQNPADPGLVETTALTPVDDDPIEAARVRAASRGRSSIRRNRRDKVRRRRILARDGHLPHTQVDPATARMEATAVISTKEQEEYLAAFDERKKKAPASKKQDDAPIQDDRGGSDQE